MQKKPDTLLCYRKNPLGNKRDSVSLYMAERRRIGSECKVARTHAVSHRMLDMTVVGICATCERLRTLAQRESTWHHMKAECDMRHT